LLTKAAGLAVTPAKVNLEMTTGQEKNVSLEVENTSSNVNLYDVWLDDEFNFIKITPQSFTLESGEKKKINLIITGERELSLATTISIIGRPLGIQEFNLTPGIKIPLSISIAPQQKKLINEYLIYTILSLMVLTVVVWLIILTRLKTKKKTKNLFLN